LITVVFFERNRNGNKTKKIRSIAGENSEWIAKKFFRATESKK